MKRIGSVGYLNAAPLTRGMETEVIFATPAELAGMLQRDEIDAALVSVTEVLLNDRYDALDGIAIASRGPVKSVLLAHRGPLSDIKEVWCHTASLTSVNLLRVLLAERGLRPEFRPLPSLSEAARFDTVLLIGDPALDFLFGSAQHAIWDLGAAWHELTGLPFVFAVWALRRAADTRAIRRALREAGLRGVRELDLIVRERTEYNLGFRKAYLGGHIRYELGTMEKQGLAKFGELVFKHTATKIFEPRFVS